MLLQSETKIEPDLRLCMSYSLHECLHDHFTHVYFDRFFLEHIQERQKFVLQLKSKQTNKQTNKQIQSRANSNNVTVFKLVHMLWFNFIVGLNLISLCFRVWWCMKMIVKQTRKFQSNNKISSVWEICFVLCKHLISLFHWNIDPFLSFLISRLIFHDA